MKTISVPSDVYDWLVSLKIIPQEPIYEVLRRIQKNSQKRNVASRVKDGSEAELKENIRR